MAHVTDEQDTAIARIHHYISSIEFDDLPDTTLAAVKTFLFDSIGVGISGSRVERMSQVKAAVALWGEAKQAQVWVTGEWLPADSAAAVNGYQIHNQEWDCVHEAAVVHPMATILSALVAYAQRENSSGKDLLLGLVVGVDIATLIGRSATTGLKFFRPSVCGCLGATAGIMAMMKASKPTEKYHISNALGIAYSQLSGTMQAHVEGSPMLGMQIGLNAQASIRAADLAYAGFHGPRDILEGPFGYFALYESGFDISQLTSRLGQEFQIEQVSHKPFPTGRAGHGSIDGLLTLQQLHGFKAEEVEAVIVSAPPLIKRLVGRPVKPDMDANYAKLCNGYLAACALLTGNVTVEDFEPDKMAEPARLRIAERVTMALNDCQDPNALAPVSVEVRLHNSQSYKIDLAAVLGHPNRPLSTTAQLAKFKAACASAVQPFSLEQIDNLINGIDQIAEMENINHLVDLIINNKN